MLELGSWVEYRTGGKDGELVRGCFEGHVIERDGKKSAVVRDIGGQAHITRRRLRTTHKTIKEEISERQLRVVRLGKASFIGFGRERRFVEHERG